MGATIMRGRSAGQRAVVAEPRSGGRLLCAASFALLGSADASGAIFTGHIEAACVASMMVYMLLFAMTWEFMTGRIEEKLKGNKAHYEMLTKVYKELMILGFIGFCVIMAKEQGYTFDPHTLHCFEFCDLMVTICVLLYITCTAISSFVEDHLEEIKTSRFAWLRHTFSSEWRAQADFKLVELLFKTKFHLQRNFDYMMYAKSVLEGNVVDMANISSWHWLTICFMSMAIYFSGPGEFDKDQFLDAFQFTANTSTLNSEYLSGVGGDDQAGGGQRRLEAAVEEEASCYATLPCGMNASSLQYAVEDMVTMQDNFTNASTYNDTCTVCQAGGVSAHHGEDLEQAKLAILAFGITGWFLVFTQGCINWSLTRRMNLILKYHGADHVSTLPTLLRHLDAHFLSSTADTGDKEEGMLDIGGGDDDGEGEDGEDEHHMMVFHRMDKDANDVLSWWMFKMLMFTAKLVQLTICFYLGFYMCHMNMRLQMVKWEYLDAIGFTDYGYKNEDSSSTPRYGVHVWIVIPILWIVFRQLPKFTKDISLLVGVLHLHEEAVNNVIQHMEVVKSIRKRIKERLEKTKIVKGKKKLKKGIKELELVEQGEFKILSELKSQDEADAGNETRLSRVDIQGLLDKFKTETADRELAAFMDRGAFREFEKEAECVQGTAQTAKTLIIAEGQPEDNDTITLVEFQTFLVRAIADACNIADEHGVATTQINRIRDETVKLSTVTFELFAEARLLARTKSLFRVVDKDHSGQVSRSELQHAFRKYRVPVSLSDMDIILRVIDPDQSGSMTMEEWLDFMLASDDNLEQQSLNARAKQTQKNAEAGGKTLFSQAAFLGGEAIDAFPGGSYVTNTIKDPLGTVVNVANSAVDIATDPVGALTDDFLPMMGMPESREPLKADFDPQGAHADGAKARTIIAVPSGDPNQNQKPVNTNTQESMDNPISDANAPAFDSDDGDVAT